VFNIVVDVYPLEKLLFSALKVEKSQERLLFELVTPVVWFVLQIQAA